MATLADVVSGKVKSLLVPNRTTLLYEAVSGIAHLHFLDIGKLVQRSVIRCRHVDHQLLLFDVYDYFHTLVYSCLIMVGIFQSVK